MKGGRFKEAWSENAAALDARKPSGMTQEGTFAHAGCDISVAHLLIHGHFVHVPVERLAEVAGVLQEQGSLANMLNCGLQLMLGILHPPGSGSDQQDQHGLVGASVRAWLLKRGRGSDASHASLT